ncbi:hypothetical protein HanPSC8_Chr11g0452311 [Helianthus annuus]|nr:hypothetical protein HanPSC8_Chr11g0452311 [Helianthus annuus]
MDPSGLCLIVKTQRQPTGFFPGGSTHFSHVLFLKSASISISIASFQFSESNACSTEFGSCSSYREAVKALASLDKFPLAMFVTGYLEGLVSFSGEYRFGGIPLLTLGGKTYLSVACPSCIGSPCSSCIVSVTVLGKFWLDISIF